MKRKKRTFYANDSEYSLFQKYAQAKGRGVSDFIRQAAMNEIKRHAPKKEIKAIIEEMVSEAIEKYLPARGISSEGI